MRKSTLDRVRDEERARQQTIEVDGWDGMHALLLNGGTKPVNPTQRELLYAPEECLAYLGVVGAAKTSAGCSLMWMLALFEPGYQALIGRKDANDLKNTTMERMTEMLYRLPKGTLLDRDKSSPVTWYIKPIAQQDGGLTPSKFVFMGLHERPASYEFHGAFVDEADEVPESSLAEVHSRCRLTGKSRKVVVTFNPTDEDHHLYRDCTGLDGDGRPVLNENGTEKGPIYRVLVPQPNENANNLVSGYYNSLRRTMPEDMVKRLIEGKWGSSLKGQPVYGKEFSRNFHVRADIGLNPHEPLYLFHDFGYRKPYTCWAQLSQATGQLRVLYEDMGENEEIHERAPRINALTQMYTHHHQGRPFQAPIEHWGDPAAKQHKDTGSTLAVLAQNGIQLHYLHNIGIDPGIRAVRHLLTRTIGRGEPASVVHSRCRVLIRTLESGYRYPENGSKQDPSKPLKGNGYDDPADAFRYGVVGLFGPVYTPQEGSRSPRARRQLDSANRVLTPQGVPWETTNTSTLAGPDSFDFGESAEYSADADPVNWRR